jgi:predicted dehydrogenase
MVGTMAKPHAGAFPRTPRIVLVGVGRFGKNHLRVLKELENEGLCEFYGIVELEQSAAKILAKKPTRFSSDFRDFLTDEVDAIDVATPANTHFCISRECLAAGKHVFVEKPLATSKAEAMELVHLARENGRTIMVGHIFRYNPAVWKIKKLLDAHEVGQVFYMFGHFTGLKDPRTDAGVLFNYGVHHIDIFDYLLEDTPREVTCCTDYFLGRREFEDVALLILKYESDILGIVECSWLPPKKQRDLTIVGSKKSLTSDLLKQTLELHRTSMQRHNNKHFKATDLGTTRVDLEFREPLRLELGDFLESIKTGKKPLADGQAALNVITVIEKALESARLRRTVAIDETRTIS